MFQQKWQVMEVLISFSIVLLRYSFYVLLFIYGFSRRLGGFETYGIVTFVNESAFEVILLEFGLTERVQVNVCLFLEFLSD